MHHSYTPFFSFPRLFQRALCGGNMTITFLIPFFSMSHNSLFGSLTCWTIFHKDSPILILTGTVSTMVSQRPIHSCQLQGRNVSIHSLTLIRYVEIEWYHATISTKWKGWKPLFFCWKLLITYHFMLFFSPTALPMLHDVVISIFKLQDFIIHLILRRVFFD